MVSPFVGNIKCIDKSYHIGSTLEITSPFQKHQDQVSHAKDSLVLPFPNHQQEFGSIK
jgi:hypothetical protein